jgi:ribosomal protein S18 acetylase RimI-like enzyme
MVRRGALRRMRRRTVRTCKAAAMLVEARGLSAGDLEAIGGLERRVVAHDGGRLKLEWATLRRRSGDDTDDLLWWDSGRLVGFLGLYRFGGGPLELAGMVEPSMRRRGIGTALLERALQLAPARRVEHVLLVVPRTTAAGGRFALSRGGVLDHSEHFLVLGATPPVTRRHAGVVVRDFLPEDAEPARRILAEAFGHSPDGIAAEPGDRPLVVELAGEVIGFLRVGFEGSRAGIYGFAVEARLQGRGIGRDVLSRVCAGLREEGVEQVTLEVAVGNDRALGLYTSVGFERRATEDYYALTPG